MRFLVAATLIAIFFAACKQQGSAQYLQCGNYKWEVVAVKDSLWGETKFLEDSAGNFTPYQERFLATELVFKDSALHILKLDTPVTDSGSIFDPVTLEESRFPVSRDSFEYNIYAGEIEAADLLQMLKGRFTLSDTISTPYSLDVSIISQGRVWSGSKMFSPDGEMYSLPGLKKGDKVLLAFYGNVKGIDWGRRIGTVLFEVK